MVVYKFLYIVAIIIGGIFPKVISDSKSCKRQECDSKMTVSLIDDKNIPLTVSFDMSKTNERIKQFVAEAIEEKMSELTNTKLEEVLASMNLEKNLQNYVDGVKNNLMVNITPEIQKEAKGRVKIENTRLRKEELALSICTSLNRIGHTKAVRRTYCSDRKGGNCNNVCKQQNKRWSCFDAVHVYNRDQDILTAAYKYGTEGCTRTSCGPNVCCCRT